MNLLDDTGFEQSPLFLKNDTVEVLSNLLPDWRDLAFQFGLSPSDIGYESEDPVQEIIELWCNKNCNVTVNNLITCLRTMNHEILMDTMIPLLEKDCYNAKGLNMDMSQSLSLNDIKTVSKGQSLKKYNAVVLFNDKDPVDKAFSLDLIERLRECQLDLFVPQYDLLVGTRGRATSVEVIEERCKKVIAIYSPSFLLSRKNEFLAKFAHHIGMNHRNSKKFIPIIFRKCQQPEYQMYQPIRYSTDDRIVNFWAKLFQTFEVTATNELIHLKPIEEYANGSSNSIEGQTRYDPSPELQPTESTALVGNSRNRTVRWDLAKLLERIGMKLGPNSVSSRVPNVKYDDLKLITNYFAPENCIGSGGFGAVYKGTWNMNSVAVKVIERKARESLKDFQQFVNEYQSMHGFASENILLLMACSLSKNDPYCLVYQLMPNGSVFDRLTDPNTSLTWSQRANIAFGTAKGLTHLHANKLIHRDIKSKNILLDKHFEPKIGDFGLANYSQHGSKTVAGTRSYLPEEYVTFGILGPQVDVFCYGIFLFELVTGKQPSKKVIETEDKTIRELMLENDVLDPSQIDPRPDSESCRWPHYLYAIGKDCTRKDPKARESMERIAETLEILYEGTNCSFSDEDENISDGSALDSSSEKNESCSDSESSVFSESDDTESTQSDPE